MSDARFLRDGGDIGPCGRSSRSLPTRPYVSESAFQWLEGSVFEPLNDVGYFQRFFLEGGTVTWPNGADIVPETLHESAKSSAAA